MFSRSLFRKEGFEIWGCSFVSELKLRSTSSAEKNFSDEITWITFQKKKVVEKLILLPALGHLLFRRRELGGLQIRTGFPPGFFCVSRTCHDAFSTKNQEKVSVSVFVTVVMVAPKLRKLAPKLKKLSFRRVWGEDGCRGKIFRPSLANWALTGRRVAKLNQSSSAYQLHNIQILCTIQGTSISIHHMWWD